MSGGQRIVAERYRLLQSLGSGGMGRVWLARDEMLRREVAVKEVVFPAGLPPEEREDLCLRTLREARAAGRLSHANVVQIYDVVETEGRPWIVMELVRSRSLYQVIKQDGPLPPKRVAIIGLFLIDALRAAHRAGVLHRDVKPGNVLLSDDGRVVLTDFGLATFDGGDGNVTRAGLILGSAQYIAPERARDGASGPETDMWSLGATLYAAVEGRSPYARDTSMATLTALATEPPDPPQRAGPLKPVLIGLLRKNPKARMGANEAERLLRRVASGEAKGRSRQAARPRDVHHSDEAARSGAADASVGEPPRINGAARRAGQGTAMAIDTDRPHPHTITEETLPAPRRRQRWPFVVVGLTLLGLLMPVAALIFDKSSRTGGSVAPPTNSASASASASPTQGLTRAMGVQACAALAPGEGVPVKKGTVRPGEYGLEQGFTYYRDPAGFKVGVGIGWRLSRVEGSLLCFRDPNSRIAVGVDRFGQLPGSPAALLAGGESDWRKAADLRDYSRINIQDLILKEGGADLEYTYLAPDDTKMHGENRMVRLGGRVYTVYWLTTDFSWGPHQPFRDKIQASFDLDEPA